VTPQDPKPATIGVLIVDDHPLVREGILAWIARQPQLHSCGCAETAAETLALVAANRPQLVLLDLRLKGCDGLDLIGTITSAPNPPRIIVISHKDEQVFAGLALRAGASGYLPKEEAVDTLGAAIMTVMAGGIHVSAEVRRQLLTTVARTPAETDGRAPTLARRELQVLGLLGSGLSTKEIALELHLSAKTVEFYREALKKKLGTPNSLALVRLATLWRHEGRC
jgi:DNA-binding NarL/FixJ family response regulator